MFWGEYPANQSPGLCRLDDILSCYNKIIILLYQDKYNKINKLFKQDNKLFKQDKKEKKMSLPGFRTIQTAIKHINRKQCYHMQW